jgi:hypothetical protein
MLSRVSTCDSDTSTCHGTLSRKEKITTLHSNNLLHMLKTWIRYSTSESRSIVRAVLSSHGKGNIGVPTQEIYDLAIKQFPDAKTPTPPEKFYPPNARGRGGKIPMPVPEPPNRDHPIRSMRQVFSLSMTPLTFTLFCL